ncbi:ComEA family DNA-binding protein [Adlercreutzia sp. R21]|uniref:ComEA family DNA-binding protein n=1 Tax=Adlercreutzia wanghongyangiae TaxID=3111451 RepID=A0ABU6IHW0_9ACTN|nr:ComEA family DNA-binding protein [Adlercreutzia sp. R21]MEC4175948.1 ComEA family DNA-binding protein [Adlercreutzia sp. R7]MEC4184068.1 ComEA family DNA-binding protein [Adlercreutzia sp. R21]
MAFQDQAERLSSKLHLSAVPRPVFLALAVLLAVLIAAGAVLAGLPGAPAAFEVQASAEPASDADGATEGTAAVQEAADAPTADVVLPESAAAAPQLCVHVDGAVRVPGVYYLDAGSRIVDAVAAAGGLTEAAQTAAVNLARVLQDGEQVVIPDGTAGEAVSVAATDGTPGASASGGLVDINRASESELTALPGVGEATAAKIVADREANGPFKTVEDLKRVSGIGEKKFEALRDLICV